MCSAVHPALFAAFTLVVYCFISRLNSSFLPPWKASQRTFSSAASLSACAFTSAAYEGRHEKDRRRVHAYASHRSKLGVSCAKLVRRRRMRGALSNYPRLLLSSSLLGKSRGPLRVRRRLRRVPLHARRAIDPAGREHRPRRRLVDVSWRCAQGRRSHDTCRVSTVLVAARRDRRAAGGRAHPAPFSVDMTI